MERVLDYMTSGVRAWGFLLLYLVIEGRPLKGIR
jgi:hypothetical protein